MRSIYSQEPLSYLFNLSARFLKAKTEKEIFSQKYLTTGFPLRPFWGWCLHWGALRYLFQPIGVLPQTSLVILLGRLRGCLLRGASVSGAANGGVETTL